MLYRPVLIFTLSLWAEGSPQINASTEQSLAPPGRGLG